MADGVTVSVIGLIAIAIGMSVLAYLRMSVFDPPWLVEDRKLVRFVAFVLLFSSTVLLTVWII